MVSPLDLLFESEGLPSFDLPDELARLYGGPLGFATPRLYANFVSTLDGVVAISSVPESNKIIAAGARRARLPPPDKARPEPRAPSATHAAFPSRPR